MLSDAFEPVSARATLCGAKIRAGHPYRRKPEPGAQRCANHSGKSTGPKTDEGRARIYEMQRKRWLNKASAK
ncbi:HGGxSTG domain-containing protein [Gymnodinialimonas ulvae]|uniref:HGGxSTG domain-containing protein n=1 Tax=Gymnodinialimonas ulvae TaxID=3126504 RepID=UPI003F701B4F